MTLAVTPAADQIAEWRAVHAPWTAKGLDLFVWDVRAFCDLVAREKVKGGAIVWRGPVPTLCEVPVWTAPTFRPGFAMLRQGGQDMCLLDLSENLAGVGLLRGLPA